MSQSTRLSYNRKNSENMLCNGGDYLRQESTIEKYLKIIAESLYYNRAAVMIGAGFSKNADKSSSDVNKAFCDWGQLADSFYEKLHGTLSTDNVKYISPLSLAHEVEILFGRPILDGMLKDLIPDMEYIPSEIYSKLLSLPWKDIFTTNYDTLLERACENIPSKRFNVVHCKEDLINSADATRIIKLHGSFPSHRPFIITEEDYRRYPQIYAPFVNTVQQSLIENTFCMIGFSCDDPNFLNWIGWIRDHLGKENSQKIYMISISGESEAKQKKLLDRNIIVINLKDMWPDAKVPERINAFFLYLQKIIDDKYQAYKWIGSNLKLFFDNNLNIELCINTLTRLRKTYPGWIVLPWSNKKATMHILSAIHRLLHTLKTHGKSNEIDFIYEYVLFLNICGRPIFRNEAILIEEIISRHIQENNEEDFITKRNIYQIIWLHLLRAYRENGMHDQWQSIYEKLNKESLLSDDKHFFEYEKCMHALFNLKLIEFKKSVLDWVVNENDIYWALKKASLFVEIGEHQRAKDFALKALNLTRKTITQNNSAQNYRLYSIENCLVALIKHMDQATDDFKNVIEKNEIIRENRSADFDWYYENEHYELLMYSNYNPPNTHTTISCNFDLAGRSITSRFPSIDEEAITAFEYLRFREDTGHPFRIRNVVAKKGVTGAIKRIANYNPSWAFSIVIRANEKESIDDFYSRMFLHEFSMEEIDAICDHYINIINTIMTEINPENWFKANNVFEFVAELLPEFISRLCSKCSLEMLDKILDCSLTIYKSEMKDNFKNISNLLRRTINAYKVTEQIERIEKLCGFPIIYSKRKRDFPDPVLLINLNNIDNKIKVDKRVYNKIISPLINKIEFGNISEDDFSRLVTLSFIIEMEEKECHYLETLLWRDYLSEGIPVLKNFYNIALLNLPVPSSIDLNSRLRDATMEQFRQKVNSGVVSSCERELDDVISLINKKIIGLNELTEIVDLSIKMFNGIRSFLGESTFATRDHVISYLTKVSIMIARVIVIADEDSGELKEADKEKIEGFIRCLHDVQVDNAYLGVIYKILIKKEKDIYQLVLPHLLSLDDQKINNVILAILDLFQFKNNLLEEFDWEKVTELIAERILYLSINCEASIIQYFSAILCKLKIELTTKTMTIVIYALKHAVEKTIVNSSDSLEITIKKYENRQAMAGLAFELWQFYSQTGNTEVPKILNVWKEICESPNEIVEVRNQWI